MSHLPDPNEGHGAECPPPGGGGLKPADGQLPYIGQTGTFRVYGQESLDCAAIVTWVWPVEDGEEYPRVNVTLFLNTNSGTSGLMQKRKIHLWGMPEKGKKDGGT